MNKVKKDSEPGITCPSHDLLSLSKCALGFFYILLQVTLKNNYTFFSVTEKFISDFSAPIFCAILPKTNHNKLIEIERPNNQTTQVGQICMTVEHFRPNSNESQSFFECAPLSEEERKEYDIQSKYLGVWTVRKCAEGFSFDGRKQKCVDKKKLHRQQAQCLQNPGTMGCQQYCQPNRWSEPSAGAACNWQYSLLYYTPEDTHSFLQCAQTSAA